MRPIEETSEWRFHWALLGVLVGLLAFGGAGIASSAEAIPYRLGPIVWKDAHGAPLPFQSREAIEEFLRNAEVISLKPIREGTANAKEALLSRDGIEVRACFRTVHVSKQRERLSSGAIQFNFKDEALFEVAAYELSKLMGIPSVPPAVERRIRDMKGTLQLWIPRCMMEKDRKAKGIEPPNRWRWAMEMQVVTLFDNLIVNDDRNLGNLLIDSDWRVWMIDHTRAFRNYSELPYPDTIRSCEAGMWEQLQSLDAQQLEGTLSAYLDGNQINALTKRLDHLVRHIRSLIEQRGEQKVLFRIWEAVDSSALQLAAK